MSADSLNCRGIVHGKTIELDHETGFPEGQPVMVRLQPAENPSKQLAPGEGIRRSAGAWADDAEALDDYLRFNRQQRKASRKSIEEGP